MRLGGAVRRRRSRPGPCRHRRVRAQWVEAAAVALPDAREIGIVIETRAEQREDATLLASVLTHYLLHYGYPGRKATAGNVAYPLSPNVVEFTREDGSAGAMVIQGTRDPVFQENFDAIRHAVEGPVASEFPEAMRNAQFTLTVHDANHPAALLRTVDTDPERLAKQHQVQLEELNAVARPTSTSLTNLDTPDFYEWTLFHLFANREIIEGQLFPDPVLRRRWRRLDLRPHRGTPYFDVGVRDCQGDTNEPTLSVISSTPVTGDPIGYRPLREMAVVIRTKDAGINRLTYDVIFNTAQDYATALRSDVFTKDSIVKMLPVDTDHVVGAFRVDTCNAIKISIDRPVISASADERYVFGAQQQAEFILKSIPAYADPAERNAVL